MICLLTLLSLPARAACFAPAPPDMPGPQAGDAAFAVAETNVKAYLAAVDSYLTCVKADAKTLPPVERAAALEDYALGFDLMRHAVDDYNAALAARRDYNTARAGA